MARLYLVKHAPPRVEPARPPRDWHLTDEGRRRAAELGDRLIGRGIVGCPTSDEPKAHETGAILGGILGVPVAVVPGLHEQDRSADPESGANPMPFFRDAAAFEAAVAEIFARPGERVFGRESADEAHDRFTAAIEPLLAGSEGPLAVVAHGTVISLFVARRAGLDVFPLWRSLGLPSCAVLSLPDFRLIEILQPLAG